MRRRCSSRRPTGRSATRCKSRSERFTVLPPPECLARAAKQSSALQRAYALLDEDPQHPMRGRLLHGFGFMLRLRAEYAEALAVADRAEALGSATNDPVLLSTACTVHGQVDQLQGRSRGRPDMAGARARAVPSSWTWVLENSWSIRRSRCSVCSQSLCFILARSSKRAPALQRAYVRARDRGLADGAARRDLVQRAVRGASRQRRARGRSCG